MTVTLTPEQEKFVAEKVRQGEYSSPEIIVSEGLKLVQAREEYQRHLAQLRGEIDTGLEQANRGELIEGEQVLDRLLEKNQRRPRRQ